MADLAIETNYLKILPTSLSPPKDDRVIRGRRGDLIQVSSVCDAAQSGGWPLPENFAVARVDESDERPASDRVPRHGDDPIAALKHRDAVARHQVRLRRQWRTVMSNTPLGVAVGTLKHKPIDARRPALRTPTNEQEGSARREANTVVLLEPTPRSPRALRRDEKQVAVRLSIHSRSGTRDQ